MTAGPMQQLVESVRVALRDADVDYLCITPLGGRHARVRFVGRFGGEDVVWDAELTALGPAAPAQFIEVDEAGPRGVPIRIGLRVACIDVPTLQKSIIMVRNYKRLCTGRHEYGRKAPE